MNQNTSVLQIRAQRLREARLKAGYTSAMSAAKAHGWPASTYGAHENGNRHFGKEIAEIYAKAYRVDLDWLWVSPAPTTPGAKTFAPNAHKLRDMIPVSTRRISVLGRVGADSNGYIIMTSQPVDTVVCPPSLENVSDAYALWVVGESMEPRYQPGEIVYIHPGKPYKRGDFVVAQITSEDGSELLGFIKQFVSLTPSLLVLRQFYPQEELSFERSRVRSIHKIVLAGEA